MSVFAEQTTGIEVEIKSQIQETTYCLSHDPCRWCWTTYQNDLNGNVLQHLSQCPWPLEHQGPYLGKLLDYIWARDESAKLSIDTFFWGRLAPDASRDGFEMAFRLSLAASRSTKWDSQKGRPQHGHSTTCITDLANGAAIYPELSAVFAKHQLRLSVASVEKVLVLPATQLPYYPRLEAHGVAPDAKLPYDCLLWFRIHRDSAL
jgi:hypothetical protein